MSDNREGNDRPVADQQPGTLKMEQVRTIPGGALVRTLPPQQRYIMAPVQSSTALISSTTTIQAQVLPKVTVQGAANTVGRISTIPVQSSVSSSSGFHVPKGPAAVANITVPRSSNLATPIVRGASLQAITVAPHSIPGSGTSSAPTMHIGGRPVVSSVAPWVGISTSQQGTVPRPGAAQIRPTVQQISEPPNSPELFPYYSTPDILTFSSSFRHPRTSAICTGDLDHERKRRDSNMIASDYYRTSDDDADPSPRIHSPVDSPIVSDDDVYGETKSAKISSQIRPLENRMLVHSSTTHKQVITQQAQVQLTATGSDPSKGQTSVLKSYGGAASAARLVAPPSAPALSRITTIPPAIAVSLHSAAAVLVPNSQGIPLKTTTAQPKVITQPVNSSSVHFPSVCSAAVQPALALNTVQVSRPVMLSPSVPAVAGSQSSNVTHIKSHPGQGPPQLIQQSSSAGIGQGSTAIGKIYTDGQHAITATSQPVFIQTQGSIGSQVGPKQQLPAALIVREQPRVKDDIGSSVSSSSSVNLHGGTVYSLSGSYYDNQGYLKVPQHQSSSLIVPPAVSTQQTVHVRQATSQIPSMSAASAPQGQLRLNSAMVVETSRSQAPFSASIDTNTSMSSDTNMAALALTAQALKQTTSPRPSILRKREPEGSPIKVTKNLAPVLKGLTVSAGSPPGPSSPKRPDSGQSGQSSSGSTTESAHSSPGESPTPALKQESMEDDLPSVPSIITAVSSSSTVPAIIRPPTMSTQAHPPPNSSAHQNEMSPRKKPRKQQLGGNQITNEPTFSEDEMEFLTEDKIKKEIKEEPTEESEKAVQKKTMSLLSAYKHNWKGRNNHFNRYTDVKPKEERKPTLSEIANQKNVAQKLTGWKIYHIASHLEDLTNSETEFVNDYNATLSFLEDKLSKCRNRETEKDFHRITERVRANCQRSRVVKDHMVEAKTQLFKLLEHKAYITDIIQRNTIKRPLKKRERV